MTLLVTFCLLFLNHSALGFVPGAASLAQCACAQGVQQLLDWPLETACGFPSIGSHFFPLEYHCQSHDTWHACLQLELAAGTAQLQSVQT